MLQTCHIHLNCTTTVGAPHRPELMGAANSKNKNKTPAKSNWFVPHSYRIFLTLAHIGPWFNVSPINWCGDHSSPSIGSGHFLPTSCQFSGRLLISASRSFPSVLLILNLCLLSLICSPCCRCLRPANWWARPSSRWNYSSKEKERRPGQLLFHDYGVRFFGSGYIFLLDVVPGLDPDLGLPRLKM